MRFSPEEAAACQGLVEMGLAEDLGSPAADWSADVSTKIVRHADPGPPGRAVFVARAAGVVAGLEAAEMVYRTARTPLIKFQALVEDGTSVNPGDRLAEVTGVVDFILTGERTALNFLQHLSGVATLTKRYVDAIAGLPCKILDTRKTIPGWRLLQKYAVRCGGGHNHRMGLHDLALIKDNHIAAMGGWNPGLVGMFESLKRQLRTLLEIEVESLAQLEVVLRAGPDMVLLDNMSTDEMRKAVRMRNEKAPKVLLEASGGVNLQTVRAIAETGVDRISIGALTHSAPALDIALDYQSPHVHIE